MITKIEIKTKSIRDLKDALNYIQNDIINADNFFKKNKEQNVYEVNQFGDISYEIEIIK